MQLNDTPKKPAKELMLPLINVVLLLLIFLMMMGRISAPSPFPITPVKSDSSEESQQLESLFYSANQQLQYHQHHGLAEVSAALKVMLATADFTEHSLIIRADRDAELSSLLLVAQELSSTLKLDIKLEVQGR